MATYIKTLKEGTDVVLPRTRSEAVTMADGGTLENSGMLQFSNTIAQNVTISSNKNALSVGTVTIADGVTVTVEDGATWVVV